MNIDLECYVIARVALAQMMLLAPNEPKYRRAFNALRQALIEENERLERQGALPALVRLQAG